MAKRKAKVILKEEFESIKNKKIKLSEKVRNALEGHGKHKKFENYYCYLECNENNSSKFWLLSVVDKLFLFQKQGKKDHETNSSIQYKTTEEALKSFNEKIKQKQDEGYEIVEGSGYSSQQINEPNIEQKQIGKQTKQQQNEKQTQQHEEEEHQNSSNGNLITDICVPDYQNYEVVNMESYYLECSENNSNKFYLLQLLQNKKTNQYYVWSRYGKVQTQGTTDLKQLPAKMSEYQASLQINKTLKEKLKNKYIAFHNKDIFTKTSPEKKQQQSSKPKGIKGKSHIIQKLLKSTYKPIVEGVDGLPWESKFQGKPYIPADEEYPSCKRCNKKLIMLIQLDLETLPAKSSLPSSGLFQLFYCGNIVDECGYDFQFFSESHYLRILKKEQINKKKYNNCDDIIFSEIQCMDRPQKIINWKEQNDIPSQQEQAEIGVEEEDFINVDCEYPVKGEKFLGWPLWIQNLEYPNCPTCQQRMDYFFQLDYGEHIDISFGDSGVGFIYICNNHKDVLAFGWQCT